MNFNDIFAAQDTMLENPTWVEPNRLAHALDLNWVDYSEEFDNRVKKQFVVGANWICTDTRVGLAVYTLDGDIVAVSTQSARKSDEDVHFVSHDAAVKMRAFVLSLATPKLQVLDNLTEEIDLGWFGQSDSHY